MPRTINSKSDLNKLNDKREKKLLWRKRKKSVIAAFTDLKNEIEQHIKFPVVYFPNHDYTPSYIPEVIEMGAKGKSRNFIAASLNVAPSRLHVWADTHPEFKEALDLAMSYSLKWWEEVGQVMMFDPRFNQPMYHLQMRARFGWTQQEPGINIYQDNRKIDNRKVENNTTINLKNLNTKELRTLKKLVITAAEVPGEEVVDIQTCSQTPDRGK